MEHEQPRVDDRGPVVAPEWFVPEVLPDGWVADPIGPWDGVDSVVIYRPDRHDVLLEHGRPHAETNHGLTATGWEATSEAPEGVLWVRDRLAVAQEQPDRTLAAQDPTIRAEGIGALGR